MIKYDDPIYAMAEAYEWDKWCKEIPYLQFPADWKVKITPPFSVGIIRFRVLVKDKEFISVYLDCYEKAGSMPWPYWEIYPGTNSDCERFKIDDTEGLIAGIAAAKKMLEAEQS